MLVAMSGGVDSSVAACLLKEQGYDCVGVFMWVGDARDGDAAGSPDNPAPAEPPGALPLAPEPLPRLKKGCCSVGDACDARAVAGRLGIPFYSVNFRAEFGRIIDYFVDEYARGRTPNPCVVCNTQLKFGRLLQYADVIGAEHVATGHYARLVHRGGQPCLARAVHRAKDQSYVLFGIARPALPRCRFPLGDVADKAEVRRLAAQLGLRVHDKPESQEICFVPNNDYKELVRQRRPDTQRPGVVRDTRGRPLGAHEGIANFTIGQRRGLGVAAGTPRYVTRLDAAENTVVLGTAEELRRGELVARDVNWLCDPPAPGAWRPASVQIRYHHAAAAAMLRAAVAGGEPVAEVRFEAPQTAVTPGQAAVFYDEDVVWGGGWIG